MQRHVSARPSAETAYLRPLVRRLGAEEVHRLVDLIVHQQADPAPDEGGHGTNPS